MTIIESEFSRGKCPIHVFGAADDIAAPIVLLFMDAFGPRPALNAIAERLASEGYRVLVPHLFYDKLPFEPLRPQAVFAGDAAERVRLMSLFQSIDQNKIDADIHALLKFVDERFGSQPPVGATGYCMGGRYALTAAAASPRVKIAASFHGSNLALDAPHTRFAGITSRIYVGVAGIDQTFGGAEEGRLAAALRDSGVDHVIETYAGSHHGFVMSDLPVHDPVAAERHWTRLSQNFRERLLV